jgi:hypothetical protein
VVPSSLLIVTFFSRADRIDAAALACWSKLLLKIKVLFDAAAELFVHQIEIITWVFCRSARERKTSQSRSVSIISKKRQPGSPSLATRLTTDVVCPLAGRPIAWPARRRS